MALVALIPLATLAAAPACSDLGDAAEVHQPNIVALGNAGITTGFDDPTSGNPAIRLYDPKGTVTREEMASFLARTAGLGGNAPVANAATALTVPDGAVTPAKLGNGGAAVDQVLTATGTGVAFQSPQNGLKNAIVRQSSPVVVPPFAPVPSPVPQTPTATAAASAASAARSSSMRSASRLRRRGDTHHRRPSTPTGRGPGAMPGPRSVGKALAFCEEVPTYRQVVSRMSASPTRIVESVDVVLPVRAILLGQSHPSTT